MAPLMAQRCPKYEQNDPDQSHEIIYTILHSYQQFYWDEWQRLCEKCSGMRNVLISIPEVFSRRHSRVLLSGIFESRKPSHNHNKICKSQCNVRYAHVSFLNHLGTNLMNFGCVIREYRRRCESTFQLLRRHIHTGQTRH